MTLIRSKEDLKKVLEAHAKKLPELVPHCHNEMQTRSVLIDPYLRYLGWDTANPRMVQMESGAHIDPNRPEKVDYALVKDRECMIIIEAKKATRTLTDQAPVQIQKYFSSTNVHYAVMTNGTLWQWFQQEQNGKLLDRIPFLTIDARKVEETDIEWLWNIHPERFNSMNLAYIILSRIRVSDNIVAWLRRNLIEPSDKFTLFLGTEIGLENPENPPAHLKDTARTALQKVFWEKSPPADDSEPKQPKQIGYKPTPPKPAPSAEWLPLTEWETGHIHGKISNPMEIRMPDGSVHPIKSFRALARLVINHVDANHSGPPDPAKQTILHPGYKKRLFADSKPCGRYPKTDHVAEHLGMYFSMEQSAQSMMSGLMEFLRIYNTDHKIFQIRRTS